MCVLLGGFLFLSTLVLRFSEKSEGDEDVAMSGAVWHAIACTANRHELADVITNFGISPLGDNRSFIISSEPFQFMQLEPRMGRPNEKPNKLSIPTLYFHLPSLSYSLLFLAKPFILLLRGISEFDLYSKPRNREYMAKFLARFSRKLRISPGGSLNVFGCNFISPLRWRPLPGPSL